MLSSDAVVPLVVLYVLPAASSTRRDDQSTPLYVSAAWAATAKNGRIYGSNIMKAQKEGKVKCSGSASMQTCPEQSGLLVMFLELTYSS